MTRIAFELVHAGTDRELLLTPNCSFVGTSYFTESGWDTNCRPQPSTIKVVKSFEGEGPFDLAICGTFAGAHRMRHLGAPLIYWNRVDYGRNNFPRDVEDWSSRVVFTGHDAKNCWTLSDPGKATVIEHGIDHSLFKGWVGDRFSPLTVGNLIPRRKEKGPDLLNEVADKVPVHLLGFGNDGYPYQIGGARNVWELIYLYKRFRVYFNPANVICCSTLEAMSVGMPVVTMTPHNFKDVLAHGKTCLVAERPDEACEMIVGLMRDDTLSSFLGKNAREAVMERFDPKSIRAKWRSLFDEILSE